MAEALSPISSSWNASEASHASTPKNLSSISTATDDLTGFISERGVEAGSKPTSSKPDIGSNPMHEKLDVESSGSAPATSEKAEESGHAFRYRVEEVSTEAYLAPVASDTTSENNADAAGSSSPHLDSVTDNVHSSLTGTPQDVPLPSIASSSEEEEESSSIVDDDKSLPEDFGSSSSESDTEEQDEPEEKPIVYSFAPPKPVKKKNLNMSYSCGDSVLPGNNPDLISTPSALPLLHLQQMTIAARAQSFNASLNTGYNIAYLISLPLEDKEGESIVPLQLKNEVAKVKDMLSRTNKKVRFRSAIGAMQNFIDILMAGTNILHISCHGSREGHMGFESDELQNNNNRDPNFSVDEFVDILQTLDPHKIPDMIFLAACFSESLGKQIMKAVPLVKHIICIKETEPVRDKAILTFAPLFYQTIISGQKVVTAYNLAKNMVLERFGEQEADKFKLLPLNQNGDEPHPQAHNSFLEFSQIIENGPFPDFTEACDVNFGLTDQSISGRNLDIVKSIKLIESNKTVIVNADRDVGVTMWLRHVMERIRMRHVGGITAILYIELSPDQPCLQWAFERALKKIWEYKVLRQQDRYRAIRELIADIPALVSERIHKLANHDDFPLIERETARHSNFLVVLDGLHHAFDDLAGDENIVNEQREQNWETIRRFLSAGDALKLLITTSGPYLQHKWNRKTSTNSSYESMVIEPLKDEYMLEIFHKTTNYSFLQLIRGGTRDEEKQRKVRMDDIVKLFKGRPKAIRLMKRYIMDDEYVNNWDNFASYMAIPNLIDSFLNDRKESIRWKMELKSIGLGRYILDFKANHYYDMQIWEFIRVSQLEEMGMSHAHIARFQKHTNAIGELEKADSIEGLGLEDLIDSLEMMMRKWIRDKQNDELLSRANYTRTRIRELTEDSVSDKHLSRLVGLYETLSEGILGEILENRMELLHFQWFMTKQSTEHAQNKYHENYDIVKSQAEYILSKDQQNAEANLIMAEVLIKIMNTTNNFDAHWVQSCASNEIAKKAYPDNRRSVFVQVDIFLIAQQWNEADRVLDNYCTEHKHDWKAKLRLAELREAHPGQDPVYWDFAIRAFDQIIASESGKTPAENGTILKAFAGKASGFVYRLDFQNAILNANQGLSFQKENGLDPDSELQYVLACSHYNIAESLFNGDDLFGDELPVQIELAYAHFVEFERLCPDDSRLQQKRELEVKRENFYDMRPERRPAELANEIAFKNIFSNPKE